MPLPPWPTRRDASSPRELFAEPGKIPHSPRVLAIVGGYGSGKTEISVNLSMHLAAEGRRVQIADLDLVNPYFRCREARTLMEAHGIRVVVPPAAQAWADLPIVLPEIRGMLHPPSGAISLFDVGGDDVGARALASMRTSIADGEYELWHVINSKRPFTDTVEGCIAMLNAIERASRWRVTGLIVNSHLIDETQAADVLEGWRLASDVAAATGLPIRLVAMMASLAESPLIAEIAAPVLPLRRHMRPPWLRDQIPARRPRQMPARHATPIGRPQRVEWSRASGDVNGPHSD